MNQAISEEVMKAAKAACDVHNVPAMGAPFHPSDACRVAMTAIMAERERAVRIINKNMLCEDAEGNEVLSPRTNPGNKVGLAYATAIKDAAQFDIYTGGRITTLSLSAQSSPRNEETK